VLANGTWVTPKLLGILDDRSRLCCHAQWYLDETAETLVHGLSQAGCCRSLRALRLWRILWRTTRAAIMAPCPDMQLRRRMRVMSTIIYKIG